MRSSDFHPCDPCYPWFLTFAFGFAAACDPCFLIQQADCFRHKLGFAFVAVWTQGMLDVGGAPLPRQIAQKTAPINPGFNVEFEQRLAKAVERGQKVGSTQAEAQAQAALNDEDFKRLHTKYRLQLSEHIENCLKKLPGHLPGFRYESVVNERGWGAAVVRDNASSVRGRARSNLFSRLEMVIRPFATSHVLELAAKSTVRNKEVFNRSQYQRLTEADPTSLANLADLWTLEFAELYSAHERAGN